VEGELSVSIREGKVLVRHQRIERTDRPGEAAHPPKVLYFADPFSHPEPGMGAPAKAELWGPSPSGKKAAVRVESVPVTEFGPATTFVVVDLNEAEGGQRR
jgi:hypothetical protein